MARFIGSFSAPQESSVDPLAQQIVQGFGALDRSKKETAALARQKEKELRERALQQFQMESDIAKSGTQVTPEVRQGVRDMLDGKVAPPEPTDAQTIYEQGVDPATIPAGQGGLRSIISRTPKTELYQRKEEERLADRSLRTEKAKLGLDQQRADIAEKGLPYEQTRAYREFIAKLEAKTASKQKAQSSGKRKMSAKDVQNVQQGNIIPVQLEDIKKTISDNIDSFGPVVGRIKSANPYDTKAQTINAQVKASSQAFGRFMEGGVLRKEDEEKYKKMFPNLTDTPEIAANKLAVVSRLLAQKQKGDILALSTQGFDVSGLDMGLDIPDVPGVIRPTIAQPSAAGGGLLSNDAVANDAATQRLSDIEARQQAILRGSVPGGYISPGGK